MPADFKARFSRFAIILLTGICLLMLAENAAVRRDQEAMHYAYGTFLAHRVHGRPLSAMIHHGSLAVFPSDKGMVACSILKEGQ